MRHRIALGLALLSLAAAVPPAAPDAALERAREAADALTKQLAGTLMKELTDGGPIQAVKVCSEVAQEIASEHSRNGLTVRRVSLRYRNPSDAPDAYESEKLQELSALHARGALPKELTATVMEGEGRVLRYLRPIVIGEPCLACHGSSERLSPGVASILSRRYPDDRAVGYAVGDLRGAVSVRVEIPD